MDEKQNRWSSTNFTTSNACLTVRANKCYTLIDKLRGSLKTVKCALKETTVEPCLFLYMFSMAVSSIAVQNIHLEKSCRVNYDYPDEICDRIMARDTSGLEENLKEIQTLVTKVMSWKFVLQTSIPAVMVLFVGAWSDRTKKRKICILFPLTGELVKSIGLILDTYYMQEWSLDVTALLEALPMALTGSYIIVFMGMFSYMTDITTVEDRTFRLGIVTVCVTLGTPTGTALSGILLHALGYYGVFALIFFLNLLALVYGILRLEDVMPSDTEPPTNVNEQKACCANSLFKIWQPVYNTVMIAFKRRPNLGRLEIFMILLLYFLLVGPLYGDSQVTYLYVIRKFGFKEVEYSVYGTIDVVLGLFGTLFCITVLSKLMKVEDSLIGALAATSRITACMFFAFAPNRIWFYFGPLVNIFSHAGLPALRSIATKKVPSNEIAQLSSLMSVSEAFAPSVYMPLSNTIYAATISNFPGAFYMFDASLTIVALLLFWSIYALKLREQRNAVTNPEKKEEFARTNEITSP